MPNEIFTRITFDSVEIADFVYRFFENDLTKKEAVKYHVFECNTNYKDYLENDEEEDYELYLEKEKDESVKYMQDLIYELWFHYEAYFRGFDDFGLSTRLYRKDNYIIFCTGWHPLFEVAEYINKLFNVHVIAEIDEKLSESCDDIIRRVEYNIQNMSK
ncbi:hypothetical protein M9Y10_014821 [Tritrichomonas musculus]|uniref:Uncharacterized protein n=1 Tax=Tritrichomonas musculus TaxID=1915356 RepID=A0ABR2L0K4_9EUKA